MTSEESVPNPDQQEPDQQEPDQQEPDQQEPDQQEPDQQEPDQQELALQEFEQEQSPLSESLGWFGKLDLAVFQVEVVVVVLALVIMSVIVFTDVVYQLTLGIEQSLVNDPGQAWGTILAVGGFIWAMAYAATSRKTGHSREAAENIQQRPFWVRFGLATAYLGAAIGASVFLLKIESSTVYRIITLLLAIPVARHFWVRGLKVRTGLFIVGVALAVSMMGTLPEGYSWAQSYGLFLLLWVGFLGASIAARDRRHLRVDLMRKLVPPKWLPHFNAASYLVAAAFTAAIFYLGFHYLFGADSSYMMPVWEVPSWLPESMAESVKTFPIPEDASFTTRFLHVFFSPSQPGEVPDWLKVLSIPVSMALICIRFLGHSVAFGGMALRGEEFEEFTEAH
jgi:TRAP-type C4-dicarboxylate transport system permease small subunit